MPDDHTSSVAGVSEEVQRSFRPIPYASLGDNHPENSTNAISNQDVVDIFSRLHLCVVQAGPSRLNTSSVAQAGHEARHKAGSVLHECWCCPSPAPAGASCKHDFSLALPISRRCTEYK